MSLEAAVAAALPGARVLDRRALAGGISAEATWVRVAHEGGEREVVVRKLGALTVAQDPGAWRRELTVRQAVAAGGVPCARPLGGGAAPWPHLVLDYVAGEVDAGASLAGRVDALAEALVQVHGLELEPLAGALPMAEAEVGARLAQSPPEPDPLTREAEVRAALAARWPAPRGERCVLHGDPWPGNLVWRGEALVAVLDWEDACQGPPALDLAIARLDLAFFCGLEAGDALVARYRARSGRALADLPTWDLVAALRPAGHLPAWAEAMPGVGRQDLTLARMSAVHSAFLDRALAAR